MTHSRNLFLLATSAWFLSFGMQSVVFAWLVTLVLNKPAEMVGWAQTAMLLPGMLLMLVAGAFADRIGAGRQAMFAQGFAALIPWVLIAAASVGALNYEVLIIYALLMGLAQAFVTPARDALLNHIAPDNVQRTVLLASLCQFTFQIVGYFLAGFAEHFGVIVLLTLQSLFLLVGTIGFGLINKSAPSIHSEQRGGVINRVVEGAKTVFSSSIMRVVVMQNVAMACFFMGSFIVCFPLLLREVFSGTAQELALLNGVNSLGLVISILIMLRIGYITRPGRAMLLFQAIGAVVLLSSGLMENYPAFVAAIFVWGLCGGIAIPMGRTLLQEMAPLDQRGRVMSFYGFSFMGAGPIGTIYCGYLAAYVGPAQAIVINGISMLLVVLVIGLTTKTWHSTINPKLQSG